MLEQIETDAKYGLPLTVIKKNPINLSTNNHNSTLKNLYMLEFHPCLAVASRLPNSFKQAIEELAYYRCVTRVNDRLGLEQSFYNRLLEHLEKSDPPGYSFTAQIQKDVFNGTYVEDPLLMTELVESTLRQLEETTKNKTKKEQNDLALATVIRFLEVSVYCIFIYKETFERDNFNNKTKYLISRQLHCVID